MILRSHTSNVLNGTSGAWRVWSLSDGYLDMPADLLRDPHNKPVREAAQGGHSFACPSIALHSPAQALTAFSSIVEGEVGP